MTTPADNRPAMTMREIRDQLGHVRPDPAPADELRNRIACALEREDARNWGYDHGFENRYGVDNETDGFVDAVLAALPTSGLCSCGGRLPLDHLHADTHEPADEPETDDQRADREETEREHAAGIHTHCGLTCEVDLPTEHLRNFVIAKGYPGTKGALDELLRRAAASAPAAPALEPQDHPGADLFVALQAAGLDADEAHRRMYAYAAMVLRQEKATVADPAAPADRATDRRRLTPNEHDRAWHAIEGSAGEEGADPGTVLNAVLHALRIDPPTVEEEQAASPSRRLADEAQPTETGAPRLLWSDLLGADPDFTSGACTQCYMDRVRDRERDMSPEHAHCRAALDDEPTAATEEPQP